MATNKRLIKSNDEGGLGLSFNTVLYDGNGSTQSVTGVGFQPDLVWIKARDGDASHPISDIVRGEWKILYANAAAAEQDQTTNQIHGVTSFNSNGFTVKDVNNGNYGLNGALGTTYGGRYVAWCWKAGGAAVLDTSGDLDAYVSANQEAGFSIIKPNVQTNVNQTIPHGLTQAPDLIILKTTDASQNWFVSAPTTSGLTPDTRKYGVLNTSDAFTTGGTGAGTGYAPTVNSTFIITPGVAGVTNYDYWFGKTNIIYAFHSVEGFSKFGSYTGTGAAGNTVTLGFEPAFVMVKRTDGTQSWGIYDNKRTGGGAGETPQLLADSAGVEYYEPLILTATGFRLDGAETIFNGSGMSYIYMAFANQF